MQLLRRKPTQGGRWLNVLQSILHWWRLRRSRSRLVFQFLQFEFLEQFQADSDLMKQFDFLLYLRLALYGSCLSAIFHRHSLRSINSAEVCVQLVQIHWTNGILTILLICIRWAQVRLLVVRTQRRSCVDHLELGLTVCPLHHVQKGRSDIVSVLCRREQIDAQSTSRLAQGVHGR